MRRSRIARFAPRPAPPLRRSPQRSKALATIVARERHVVFFAAMFESSELRPRFRTLRRCFTGVERADGDTTHAFERRRRRMHAFGRFIRQSARKRLDPPATACDLVVRALVAVDPGAAGPTTPRVIPRRAASHVVRHPRPVRHPDGAGARGFLVRGRSTALLRRRHDCARLTAGRRRRTRCAGSVARAASLAACAEE